MIKPYKSKLLPRLTRNKLYIAWRNMRRRCYSPIDPAYKNYGGRNITVCERWKNSFENFCEDMGIPPDISLTLDRIDVNGNYEPDNCRWATEDQQQNNKRNNTLINGKTASEWAKETGIKANTIWTRFTRYEMSPEKCLTVGNVNKPAKAEHGTRSKYERDGCRCSKCRAFNAERAHKNKLRIKNLQSAQQ